MFLSLEMNPKYLAAGLIAFLFVIAWNVFLIKRDQKLFEAYNQSTHKEQYCQQQAHWHPDCNVK